MADDNSADPHLTNANRKPEKSRNEGTSAALFAETDFEWQ